MQGKDRDKDKYRDRDRRRERQRQRETEAETDRKGARSADKPPPHPQVLKKNFSPESLPKEYGGACTCNQPRSCCYEATEAEMLQA